MTTHSCIPAQAIPWTEGPAGYSPWGHKESDTTARQNANTNKNAKEMRQRVTSLPPPWGQCHSHHPPSSFFRFCYDCYSPLHNIILTSFHSVSLVKCIHIELVAQILPDVNLQSKRVTRPSLSFEPRISGSVLLQEMKSPLPATNLLPSGPLMTLFVLKGWPWKQYLDLT